MLAESPDRLLRFSEVSGLVGFGRSTIYRWIDAGTFPKPYKPGGVSSRWSEREVTAWIEGQKQAA